MSYSTDQQTVLEDGNFFENCDFSFVDDEKFQTIYVPKIEAYLEVLKKNQPENLKLAQELVPACLDSAVDGVKLLYDSKALSENELEITETPGFEIVKKIAEKEWTSVEVFKAFAHRAVIGNQLTNFAEEFNLDDGLARAQYLDDYLQKNGKTVGPLHGLPISIKEHLEYKGKITHCGASSMLDNIPEASCATLRIFENLGAVYYIRTSQPQTIMHLDTINNITGRTRNPYNLALSPGGSSGGEGAAVATGSSPIGIGSDIGGSIRCPAAFCGVFGFKPTTRRMSLGLVDNPATVPEHVVATLGPLARNPADLDLFMRTYVNEGKPWLLDSWALRIPWKHVDIPEPSSLKIGVLWDDGVVKPFPPIERGLKYTAEKLAKAGAKIVDFKAHRTQEAYDTVHAMYTVDGNASTKSTLGKSGEPLLPLTKWYMSYGGGDKAADVTEVHRLAASRNSLRQDYLDLMNTLDIDFIISPTSYNVAGIPNKIHYWGYTSLWNVLDMPTAVFPTGLRQDPDIDTAVKDYKPRNILEALELPTYEDPSKFKGAPIALQLTSRRYFDEEVLAAVQAIAKVLDV